MSVISIGVDIIVRCVFVLQPIAVTPQQIATLRQQQQQHSGSGPPPLLLGPRTSVPQVQGQRIIQQGLIRVASVANANVLVPQVNSVIQFKQFLLILLIKWSWDLSCFPTSRHLQRALLWTLVWAPAAPATLLPVGRPPPSSRCGNSWRRPSSRSHHPNLPHQSLTSYLPQPTMSSFTWWGWRWWSRIY